MREQRITIAIGPDGKIAAEAEGFSGDGCLHELERLLTGLAPATATIDRKADEGAARRTTTRRQDLERKR